MKRKYLYIGFVALVVVLIGLIGYYNVSHKNRWYNNTTINGIDVSGLTLQQSKEKIQKTLDDYSLTVTGRNNGKLTVAGSDIDYKATVSSKINEAFASAHKGITLPMKSFSYKLLHDVTFDESKLTSVIKKSELVKGSTTYKIQSPLPMRIGYSTSKKQFVVESAVAGNTISVKGLESAISSSLKATSRTLNISGKKYNSCYKSVANPSSKATLTARLASYNNLGLRYIKWNMGEKHYETLTPAQIAKMIVYKDGKVTYDEEKLEDYVEKLCLKYKTVGTKRTYTSHTGKKLSTTEGDYGWRVDYDKTLTQAKQAMAATISQDATNAYIKSQSDTNVTAVTKSYDINWYSTSYYKRNWSNLKDDWDQKNYTEVDLGAQMVYIFRNGKVKYSFPCISGKPVSGRKTTTGAYFVKEHQMNRTLVGENYQTPVKYWVRITWTGTGFHAAPWQSWSSWSPSYYKTRGSHGCINLSNSSAATVYKVVKAHEIVFMHY